MNRVHEVLTAEGRTISWLARSLGVSRTALYRWMRGEEPWPPRRRWEVALLLDAPAGHLFPDEAREIRERKEPVAR